MEAPMYKRISKENHHYRFDPFEKPAERAKLGDWVVFETLDCFSDELQKEDDLFIDLDMTHINPCTGPLYIENTTPGDVVALKVQEIRLRGWGVLTLIPREGVMQRLVQSPKTKIVKIFQDKNYIEFANNIKLDLRPHIGTIGACPNLPFPTGQTGIHGGNMDIPELGVGTTIYFPVFVNGTMVSLGDVHANMGNGEICIGVETGADVTLSIEKVYPSTFLRAPMLETSTHWIAYSEASSGSVGLFDLSVRMAEFLCSRTGISLEEANLLISACGDAHFGQWAESDQNYTFYMKFPKHVFTDGSLNSFLPKQ